jgi:maltose alpha-D-glucosyltransferase/alpha-amylase
MGRKSTILDDKLHWYKDAVIYEVHIKAFCDSNGDGIGDFEGLLQKLDYLQNLGITAIWLLPFYPSPLKDDGYDIADYYSINPAYGDIKQFKKLLNEAHKRNLKVITELVINHTSDQHPWFQRARRAKKGSPEREYYVWSDDPNKYDEVRIIFQDFETSNWTWDPVAQQYYWHRFFHHQPDLNYDNPLVQQEVFKILDYWCKMGVDGFRLDAVPYLFEREGTNCENLPETHKFLKSLRKHVDKNFPGTLLLAEANMWPEDSASYFGNGDECHMNYHFPVMPRMFMSLQMEDRYPITDIFDQTPAIPETCQWAIFLRNHDELTLEMVTDEERDYMYKVYVKDPKARINLGIRHRLAPLMDNNRKKIELLNYLLFSLPGTPVLYYGDEIGMGDNFYLGDRDGVRTPMQWSADKNAGFSQTNPQRLYLPVILDPAYHYEFTNVEMQSRNTSSLLWWTKRLIHTRKQYKSLSRGDLKFINTENPKILAFTRTYEDETMLIIVNLSKHVQPVELDLENYKGFQPIEAFSKNKLPVIKDSAYFLTLTGHDCLWFLLKETEAEKFEHASLQLLELKTWKDVISKDSIEELESSIIPDYLQKMRWFGGKSRMIQDIQVIKTLNIPLATNSAYLLLIQVNYQSGLPDTYQIAVTFGSKDFENKIKESCPQSILAKASVNGDEGIIYDALFGHELSMEIYERLISNDDIVDGSILKFTGSKLLRKFHRENPTPKAKILNAEQSNTSVTYDNKLFLKIYRKVDFAVNPDLEITHFLTEHANFDHIPKYAGAIIWKSGDKSMVIGMMQEMVESSTDAWQYMLERVSDFNERILAKGVSNLSRETPGSLTSPTTYNDAPAAVRELIDITVAERAALLGKRTAEMHIALTSSSDLPDFKPEYFSLHYQRSLFSSFQTLVRSTFQNQSRNLRKLPEDIRSEAEHILDLKDDILQQLKRIYSKKINAAKIRIHGDYHLGQVLFTGKDFIILDFEGEPARSYSERRLKRSPLRDVTGMLRSFHYAAYAGIILNDQLSKEDKEKLQPFAELWYHYLSGFFMHSYLETAKGKGFIPDDMNDVNLLLETYLLEKAIYELNYELNNRPDWVLIPLRGIRSIMEKSEAKR